ncbi:AAA family ATPase [Actinoplanes sp. DH11]|uniref:ATP-binding protein n=1 Tax=Actinoplanes sp. DH11 TaxID=2857011 RepID=UPI001E2E71B7|nr:LuxR family transcriptional regulator [Actinoplanes sp. DH11]
MPDADLPLFGRDAELALLDHLLTDAAAGSGAALVIRGEPGIGKTALLDCLERSASQQRMRVLRSVGAESESQLPYAAIHQLLHPLFDGIGDLPPVHRSALRTAVGLEDGEPDVFAVALAVLELVTESAVGQPVALILDDLHWFDRASGDVLAFLARRVATEPVLVVGATRTVALDDPQRRSGLPDIELGRLAGTDAAALLDARAPRLSHAVRRRLLTEAAGNPLALVELPKTVTGQPPGDPVGQALPLNRRLEAAFAARAESLTPRTAVLLLVLAADTTCDLRRLLAAATDTAGAQIGLDDAQEAIDAGLLKFTGASLRFKHPLMRSAVYQQAPVADRVDAHRALAGQLADFPDRQLWHLAAATIGTDELLADQLERYAERARTRGATMSAVAALRRAGELTDDSHTARSLLLRAAELASEIGARHEVEQLLASSDLIGLGPVEQARLTNVMEVVRYPQYRDPLQRVRDLTDIAAAAHQAGHPEVSMQLLWRAASRCFFQATGPETAEARRKVAALVDVAAPHPDDPQALAILAYTVPEERGHEILQRLRQATEAGRAGAGPDAMRFLGSAALVLGDFARSSASIDVAAADARAQGRLGVLARLLGGSNWGRLWLGQWDTAHAELTEARTLAQETGEAFYSVAAQTSIATVTAMRGGLVQATTLLDEVAASPLAEGMRYIQVALAQARGLVHLFQGDAHNAYTVLAQTFEPAHPSYHRYMRWWLVPDLLDAALAAGRLNEARTLITELPDLADRVGAPILVLAARYAAVVTSDDATLNAAETLSGELGRWPVYRARLQLHLARQLRRQRQTQDARNLLRMARDTFDTLGAEPWANMARAELRAAGEQSRQRVSSARERLSPQELQIAGLAATGLTNREIAERLFLSHRTVSSHLYRVYPKLGITRRTQLASTLNLG